MKTKLLKKVRHFYKVRYTENDIMILKKNDLVYFRVTTSFFNYERCWMMFWRNCEIMSQWYIDRHQKLLDKRQNKKLFNGTI